MPDRDRFGGSEREYSVPQRTVEPGTAFNRPLGWQRSGPATGLVDYDDYQDRVRRGDTYTGDRISTPSTRVEPPGSAFGRGQGWQRAGPATGLVDYEDYLRRIQGGQGDMDSGAYLSSRYGGGLDDAAGMNDGARGMIEGAGFEVAGGPGMTDQRTFKDLWRRAVNKFSPGTPDTTIKQEFNRLKNIFMKKKYGFKPPGPLGIGMDLGLDFLESEQGQGLYEDLYGDTEVQVI